VNTSSPSCSFARPWISVLSVLRSSGQIPNRHPPSANQTSTPPATPPPRKNRKINSPAACRLGQPRRRPKNPLDGPPKVGPRRDSTNTKKDQQAAARSIAVGSAKLQLKNIRISVFGSQSSNLPNTPNAQPDQKSLVCAQGNYRLCPRKPAEVMGIFPLPCVLDSKSSWQTEWASIRKTNNAARSARQPAPRSHPLSSNRPICSRTSATQSETSATSVLLIGPYGLAF